MFLARSWRLLVENWQSPKETIAYVMYNTTTATVMAARWCPRLRRCHLPVNKFRCLFGPPIRSWRYLWTPRRVSAVPTEGTSMVRRLIVPDCTRTRLICLFFIGQRTMIYCRLICARLNYFVSSFVILPIYLFTLYLNLNFKHVLAYVLIFTHICHCWNTNKPCTSSLYKFVCYIETRSNR